MDDIVAKYVTEMRDFLETFPYDTPYEKLVLDIEFITTRNVDAILSNVGDNIVRREKNVIGETVLHKRINFAIRMRRDTADDSFREEISNFLNRLIEWINSEQIKRGLPCQNPKLPTFSNIDADKEIISATGGILSMIIDENVSEYSVQIHVDYKLAYFNCN